MKTIRIVLALLLSPALAAQAEIIRNPAGGYAFEMSGQWRMASPDFLLEGPDGATLQEAEIPQQKNGSLEQISKTAGMIACIGADYTSTNERFALDGEKWQGLVTVFVEPRRNGRPQRHVLQLVAQHGERYRLFYFAVPSAGWLSNRERHTQVLKALRFI